MGRGSVFSPRVGSVNGYVVRGRILKNLRATISEGKGKNFPELLVDLDFFRFLRFSPRVS